MNNDWATPTDLFNLLDDEFRFNVDACAAEWNYKCEKYYTKEDDSLTKNWPTGSVVWCNPPYGNFAGKFVEHAYKQHINQNCTVVCLVPTNTEAKWFHNYALAGELRFIRGRVHFTDKNGKSGRPRFSSMVVIFQNGNPNAGRSSTLNGYRGGK
jgi:phage N-6-adenine-methyltransferase